MKAHLLKIAKKDGLRRLRPPVTTRQDLGNPTITFTIEKPFRIMTGRRMGLIVDDETGASRSFLTDECILRIDVVGYK